MLKHANVFIFLVGELITLEALVTFAHKKPIGLLNVNNIYNGLIAFF